MSSNAKEPKVGRPSNKDERSEQIMQAFVRCVVRFGIEGATLSRVAEEAGLSRPLIRHHLGNRDEMIAQLQCFVISRFTENNNALMAVLKGQDDPRAVVDILFAEDSHSDHAMTLTFAALTARARDDEALKEGCRNIILRMETEIATFLTPHLSSPDTAQDCAHGIIAIYFNVTAFEALDMPQSWADRAKNLALTLLTTFGARS
ncbi:MAG: TetR/AcrR family transcriptional regulator [Pseudomonadota bacterium]